MKRGLFNNLIKQHKTYKKMTLIGAVIYLNGHIFVVVTFNNKKY